ncbi:MAG: 23S rRNA pseudouridine(1911/1915/1917) synthase RluD [Thiotrichaceae bacterium]|nr:23S rRNA pseudouridine(1911/1915/1917) synthase RluD [Thiotrichaceae bacterium]
MISFTVTPKLTKQRLDMAIAALCSDYSRSQLQKWIKSGYVSVNNQKITKARTKVFDGNTITLVPQALVQTIDKPEAIKLNIVHEDDHIIIINKPVGLVVHPGAGNRTGTLLNGLLHAFPELESIPRAGIVHRLDKDTSGLMVVAKTLIAHKSLVEQLQERTVKREYLALVQGAIISGASIEGDIGRHPVDRKRMAVVEGAKYAMTHYRIEKRLVAYTLLRVQLETGRTHQIRVHMSWKQMPLLGDRVYGGRIRIPANISNFLRQIILGFPRQALHATVLSLNHPKTGELLSWESPMPEDMVKLISAIEAEFNEDDHTWLASS